MAFRRWVVAVVIAAGVLGAAEFLERRHDDALSDGEAAVFADRVAAQRLLAEQRHRVSEPYPYLMYRTRPSQHAPSFNVNSLGFRGRELAPVKAPGVFRVVVLGGSVVWGTGASADDTTIPGYLAGLLREARGGRPVEVVNAGDSGYESTQEVIDFWLRLADLAPDAVVSVTGFNDVFAGLTNDVAGFPQNFPDFKIRLESRGLRRAAWGVADVALASHLVRAGAVTVRRAFVARERTTAEGYSIRYAAPDDVARVFEHNMALLAAMVRARGGRFVCVLQPALGVGHKPLAPSERSELAIAERDFRGYAAYVRAVYARLTAALGRLHDEHDVTTVDLVDAFGASAPVFLDEVHVTDAANRVLAARIAAAMLRDSRR